MTNFGNRSFAKGIFQDLSKQFHGQFHGVRGKLRKALGVENMVVAKEKGAAG